MRGEKGSRQLGNVSVQEGALMRYEAARSERTSRTKAKSLEMLSIFQSPALASAEHQVQRLPAAAHQLFQQIHKELAR